jgi:hypothetical protein
MNLARFSSALVCAVLGAVTSAGCERGETGSIGAKKPESADQVRTSREQLFDIAALVDRRSAIDAEIAKLGTKHPWAGVYSSLSVDTSLEIAIAPENGYVVGACACGRVHARDGRLVLDAEFSNSNLWRSSRELVPVSWGDRRYLLAEDELLEFCNRVNSGSELSNPSRGLMIRSRDAKAFGKPELPIEFQARIFDEPLVAKVVSKSEAELTNEQGLSKRLVVLDVGRTRGAFEKMRVYRSSPNEMFALVETVHETTCEASYAGDPSFADLPIGAEFSTRRPNK